MKRLLRGLLSCLALMIVLCGAATLVGRGQAAAKFIPELQRCGETLCYLGIIPGATNWDLGIKLIRQTPQLHRSELSATLFIRSDPDYAVGLLSTGGQDDNPTLSSVGEINLNPGRTPILAGDAILRLGEPCYLATVNDDLGFYYPDAAFFVANTDTLTPASQVEHITMRKGGRPPCPPEGVLRDIMVYGWHGFRSYPAKPRS